ncbi:MAG TPA: glutamate 5-kinase [Ignavibacteriales bacterium]|nr:glutamate 5-kinase [Ignavibacteriales bacterium]HOL81754.1 glutamate 5-kinase [Ignavibacteriales bacterium]HOM65687.1 glutamate 5-kinase [Ignavibacteriales bacterium]HPD67383.1 glutamate 5-kinase [Ignavibacteriales bacterium]HPP32908.1 glutamate 5-kinase [Ignavibacteriales bacterium]
MQNRKKYLSNIKRIVIKFGTKVILSNKESDKENFQKFINDVVELKNQGYEIVIVSSGAVGLGLQKLNLNKRPKELNKIQALASIGQNLLMNMWADIFEKYNITVGQILLTYDVIQNRQRFLYARDTFNTLLKYGVIPIVNENDSLAVDELKFGDNDTLSSITASMLDADLLILYTDTDGIYDKNPKLDKSAKRLTFIENIDSKIYNMISDSKNDFSLGGMTSKITAAKNAIDSGISCIIALGTNPRLKEILNGDDIGTFIKPKKLKVPAKKRWLKFNKKLKGGIIIDDGAYNALIKKHVSILPVGVINTIGTFNEGDLIAVYNFNMQLIAKGLVYYSSEQIQKVKQMKTKEIQKLFKWFVYDEIIDRNNLILLN